MTICVRCTALNQQITRRNSLRLAYKEAEVLRERAGWVRPLREQLNEDADKIRVLQRKGIAVVKPSGATAALDTLRQFEDSVSGNAPESGREFGRLKRAIEKLAESLGSSVNTVLKTVVPDLSSISEPILKQIELLPGRKEQVARIRTKREELFSGRSTSLEAKSSVDLESFLDNLNELRALADELSPQEFPKEVLEFFKAVRQGGAPLDKLTESVREWLAARGQLKDLRITIATR
jgi:hypothetical protein